MSEFEGGGVVGTEISAMRKDQALMGKELEASKAAFAEYIKGLGDQMHEQLSVPAELLNPDTVTVKEAVKEKKAGFFKRFLEWLAAK